MRPIDADAYGEKLYKMMPEIDEENGETCMRRQMTYFCLAVLNDMPTIAPPPNDPLTSSALEAVRAERKRQDALWGDQSGNSLFEWMSILGEEYGELCEAVNETCFKNSAHPDRGGVENIAKEATQVAAVALEIIEAAYRRKPEEKNNGITTLR